MADFTVHIPDAFVPRVVDPVEDRLQSIRTSAVVVDKILPWLGVATVDDLTPTQKPEVVCQHFLWSLTANVEAGDARDIAWQDAVDQAVDDFSPGT